MTAEQMRMFTPPTDRTDASRHLTRLGQESADPDQGGSDRVVGRSSRRDRVKAMACRMVFEGRGLGATNLALKTLYCRSIIFPPVPGLMEETVAAVDPLAP